MTDEQFEKFMAVQVAQLSMLQVISRNVQNAATENGRLERHDWKATEQDVKSAMDIVKNL